MSSENYQSFDPERWNECIKLLCDPIDQLDEIQATAALVFHFYGRVMNGGHTLHFDYEGHPDNDEMLQALKKVGAIGHASLFLEACMLRQDADEADAEGRIVLCKLIEELDRSFYHLKPTIPEILAKYFHSHPGHFPE